MHVASVVAARGIELLEAPLKADTKKKSQASTIAAYRSLVFQILEFAP